MYRKVAETVQRSSLSLPTVNSLHCYGTFVKTKKPILTYYY